MGLRDGLTSLEVKTDNILVGSIVSGTYALFGASEIGNTELAANAASGTKLSLEIGPIYTGSPNTPNNSMQFGAGSLGAGSDAWTVFGKAFAAAPRVIITPVGATARASINVFAGSVTAGSFYAFGGAASENFYYLAAGSGRI